jgi:hypothetical protein
MHMARLADPSQGPGEYSLSNCSKRYNNDIEKNKEDMIKSMLKDPDNSEARIQTLLMFK